MIVVHDHDVLSGRGVNIAQHPGNERFRALVQTRHDEDYCASYTTSEKREVAKEIISHLSSCHVDPPGRFLKRTGRANNARGLQGPWEELSEREAVKKTCQALRDCNRQDRTGYAAAVQVPDDVRYNQELRSKLGLSNKEYAEQMAQAAKAEAELVTNAAITTTSQLLTTTQVQVHTTQDTMSDKKRARDHAISPSGQHAAEWLKKQRTTYTHDPHVHSTNTNMQKYATPLPTNTPTTVASSGASAYTQHHHHHHHHHQDTNTNTSLMDTFHHHHDNDNDDVGSSPENHGGVHGVNNIMPPGLHITHHDIMPASPSVAGFHPVHINMNMDPSSVAVGVSYADTFEHEHEHHDPPPPPEEPYHHQHHHPHVHHNHQHQHHPMNQHLNHVNHGHGHDDSININSLNRHHNMPVMPLPLNHCNDDHLDPLHIAAEAAAAIQGPHHHYQDDGHDDHHHHLQATEDEGYAPPSPFHPDHHGGLTDEHEHYDDDV
jgi:hypothetical protein